MIFIFNFFEKNNHEPEKETRFDPAYHGFVALDHFFNGAEEHDDIIEA